MIVTNGGTTAFERVAAFEDVFHKQDITVIKRVMLEENADAKTILASGAMEDIKNNGRGKIYVKLKSIVTGLTAYPRILLFTILVIQKQKKIN